MVSKFLVSGFWFESGAVDQFSNNKAEPETRNQKLETP